MERDEVMKLVRDHLSTELEVAPDRIQPETRFREDLDADSLDLYELVMELEDRYGIRVSEEEAAEIETVGDAVDFVCARVPAAWGGAAPEADPMTPATASLAELFADAPEELRRQALSHSSWVETPHRGPTAGSPSSATASSASRSRPCSSPSIRTPTSASSPRSSIRR